MDEFKNIMFEYAKSTEKLVEWAKDQLKTPFADTEDGKQILKMISDISLVSSLLNMKALLMFMQEDILNHLAEDEDN